MCSTRPGRLSEEKFYWRKMYFLKYFRISSQSFPDIWVKTFLGLRQISIPRFLCNIFGKIHFKNRSKNSTWILGFEQNFLKFWTAIFPLAFQDSTLGVHRNFWRKTMFFGKKTLNFFGIQGIIFRLLPRVFRQLGKNWILLVQAQFEENIAPLLHTWGRF